MKIKDTNNIGNQHTFEVVEKIPVGFFVWNIGKNIGHDEYIPLCEKLYTKDKNNCTVNIDTLKAIKLSPEEVQKLIAASEWGVNSLSAARKALKSKRNGYVSNKKRVLAELTIEIFERVTA